VDNCGLNREELEWFTDIARRILSAKRFAENYLYRNLINEFIRGLLAMNCDIVSTYSTARSLNCIFKCGKDIFVESTIYDEHLTSINRELRVKLFELQGEGNISTTELRPNYFSLGILGATSMGERLVVFYGEHLKLLERNSVQYDLVGIEDPDSGINFVVLIKIPPFFYITKYYFDKEGECKVIDNAHWYWYDPRLGYYYYKATSKYLPPEEHVDILKAIYNKRNIIEERLNNAIYLTLKIPSTILLY
jgi:hypothetical protein